MAAPRKSAARTLRHGERTIAFELVRSDRRTLGLTVRRDGSVVVRAPRRAREEDVVRWVAGHAEWILRCQRDAAERARRDPPRRFVDGETHLYLGREYRLTIAHGEAEDDNARSGTPERVRLDDGAFRVVVDPHEPPGRVADLMDAWYLGQAREEFAQRLDACWASFPCGDGQRPTIRVKRMRSRWGSMSAKRSMSLRLDLIRAPAECIDYVIVHELCHLLHPHHGPAFWALVEQQVPDWKDRRRRLESRPA